APWRVGRNPRQSNGKQRFLWLGTFRWVVLDRRRRDQRWGWGRLGDRGLREQQRDPEGRRLLRALRSGGRQGRVLRFHSDGDKRSVMRAVGNPPLPPPRCADWSTPSKWRRRS